MLYIYIYIFFKSTRERRFCASPVRDAIGVGEGTAGVRREGGGREEIRHQSPIRGVGGGREGWVGPLDPRDSSSYEEGSLGGS